jgi:RNA polymerase sigma factor (sigma-70 family)
VTTFEELWNQHQPAIDGLAAEFGRKAHSWGAEASDFSQEAAAWMLDREEMLVRVHDEMYDSPDDFARWLLKCLRNEFRDYLVDIRGQATGCERQDCYWYSRAELEALLDSVFNDDAWQEPPVVEGGGRSSKPAAHGGNWIATLADVSRAFSRLPLDDQLLLGAFHEEGKMNKEVAAEYETTEAAMSAKHGRAIERLLKILGGPRPDPMRPGRAGDPWRGRHAVSNATARAVQDFSW